MPSPKLTPAKLILTVGFPGSGKTTKSNKVVCLHTNAVIVCRDDIRAMILGSSNAYESALEPLVIDTQKHIARKAIQMGYSVIVADTNISRHIRETWVNFCQNMNDKHGSIIVEYGTDTSFLDVSLEECIERDLAREKIVGSKVIIGMAKKLIPQLNTTEYNKLLFNYPNVNELRQRLEHEVFVLEQTYNHTSDDKDWVK